MKIQSLSNSKIKEWNKLKEKKYRDEVGLFLIEGDHLIKEALKNNMVVATIGLNSSYDYEVTQDILNKLSSQKSGTNEIAVVKKIKEKEIMGNVIILDNIQDPGNLGTIIRSAVAFNIDTIILSFDSVDLYNDKVIRASEGMLFNINIIRKDLKEAINELKKDNYTIYATTVSNTGSFEKDNKKALIIGNEGNGIRPEILELCDKNITIPMNEKCESLNAGVCASILMYLMENE
jgi:TrmH family RNA methyltransferase